jgi:prepilin-type N-terminal cleavage/methylation domain-containing protein
MTNLLHSKSLSGVQDKLVRDLLKEVPMKDLRYPPDPSRAGGFSLVELLIVMGLIGILAAVGGPPLAEYLRFYRVNGAAQQVSSEIQAARMRAIMRNVNYGVVFVTLSPTTYQWVMEDDVIVPAAPTGVRPSLTTQAGKVEQRSPVKTLPPGITFGVGVPTGRCAAAGGGGGLASRALRFHRLGDFCDPLSNTVKCPDVDFGVPQFSVNVNNEAVICLIHAQKLLERPVVVSAGGRVRTDQ